MRLTKKRAIDWTIELWEWLAETGGRKGRWEGWEKYGESDFECFLCDYGFSLESQSMCMRCPYHDMFGKCEIAPTFYCSWRKAKSVSGRKKYAKLFLAQMFEVRDGKG